MMIGMQGLGLWAFTSMAAWFGPEGRHVSVFILWTSIQAGILWLLGTWSMGAVERILPHGFELRRMWLELFHTGTFARDLANSGWKPLVGAVFLATAGSLLTGGLTGSWLIVHGTNYIVFFIIGLMVDIGFSEPSHWLKFIESAIPLGQVVFLAGLWLIHLGLSPWLWQHRQLPEVSWRLQRPLVGLGIGAGAAGCLLLLL